MEIKKFTLLEYINSLHQNICLEDCHIICVQHIVASTISLFDSLFEKGLRPRNLSAIGKCYSTRPEALKYLINYGVDIASESLYFNPYNPFDFEFKHLIIKFFQKRIKYLVEKKCKQLIVLDDGGELILFINDLLQHQDFWKGKVVGIEQTTAGYDKLRTASLLFPVINVARSDVKLFHESPFIARVAADRLIVHLNKLQLSPKNVLIIGNGAIGSQIYSAIHELFKTEIFDLDLSKSTIQKELYPASLKEFDLIIGCTGKTVVHPNHFQFLKKNVCLASVSSSDREFSGASLRRKVENITSCHQHIHSENIHLLNCGFPINFDDAYVEIDIKEFQLTRAILLAGIYQSISKSYEAGLIDLDSDLQKKYIIYTIKPFLAILK